MKEKITSILRHLFTGGAAFAVDQGWIAKEDADSLVRLLAAAVAIIISRLLIWLLEKYDFLRFLPWMGRNANLLLMAGISMVLVGGLASCTPSHYEVNTEPYAEQIAKNPTQVKIKAEHVKPINDFKLLSALETTPDGCLLVKKTFENGTIGKAGYCLDGRYVVQWQGVDLEGKPVELRAVYRRHGGAYEVFYWSGSIWLEVSSKSGIVIGTPPSEQGEAIRIVNSK